MNLFLQFLSEECLYEARERTWCLGTGQKRPVFEAFGQSLLAKRLPDALAGSSHRQVFSRASYYKALEDQFFELLMTEN
ncbi:hypothetical protein IAD21_03634 [Abditibacteriota bacterium]|nr:hypothetical protein IAD21_03634 [Abditibacteriota bacterium]